jgi:hypothetical protein
MDCVLTNTNSIIVLAIYFGKLPSWFPLFLNTCMNNPDTDYLIFSDQDIHNESGGNIRVVFFTMNDFNQLASKKLNFRVSLLTPYKLCDFKPMYGEIFSDYITGYKFWGYCDSDIFFGRIDRFITPDMLNKYDIISTYAGFLSGPFCLYRNSSEINGLYKMPAAIKN